MELKKFDVIRLRRANSDDEWAVGTIAIISTKTDTQILGVLLAHGCAIKVAGGLVLGATLVKVNYVTEKIEVMCGDGSEEFEIEVADTSVNLSSQPEFG